MTTKQDLQIKYVRNHAGNYSSTAAETKYRIIRKGGFWWLLYESDYQAAVTRANGQNPVISTGNAKQFKLLGSAFAHLDKLDRVYWNQVVPF